MLKDFFAKNRKTIFKYFIAVVALLVLSVALGAVTLVLSVMPSDLSLMKLLLTNFTKLFLNSLPLFLVMTGLYFATGRMWISFLSTGLLAFAVAEVNRFKVTFRDDPFVFSDLLLIGEAKKMTESYKLFLDMESLAALIFIAAVTVACVFFVKAKPRGAILRISGAVAAVIVLVISCNTLYFSNGDLHNSMWSYHFGNQWKTANQYMSRGVVYSFIRSIPSAFTTPPEGYDAKVAEKILDEYTDEDIPDSKKVHTISIMLEAYNDLSQFEGLEFGTDPYENFHKLQEDSYSGKLYTNIFSAGTVDTERAFLTGYSDISMKKRDTNSFVHYFNSQGYFTEAMHPGYGWFYDRKNIDSFLGFQGFKCQEDTYYALKAEDLKGDKHHGLISDLDFFDSIIEGYEKSVESDKKYFNFSVTYQNHGPYDSVVHTDVSYAVKKDGYTDAEYNILNNYLTGIYKTDLALGKLRDFADSQSEPIVLILFGDHNPWLGDGNTVYNMLGIDLNLDTVSGNENYYQTPYVIYANAAAKKTLGKDFVGEGNTISPMFLMQEYFSYVGLKGPKYLNYLTDLRKEYSVIGKIYTNKNGEYLLSSEMADNKILQNHKWVEYYMKTQKVFE